MTHFYTSDCLCTFCFSSNQEPLHSGSRDIIHRLADEVAALKKDKEALQAQVNALTFTLKEEGKHFDTQFAKKEELCKGLRREIDRLHDHNNANQHLYEENKELEKEKKALKEKNMCLFQERLIVMKRFDAACDQRDELAKQNLELKKAISDDEKEKKRWLKALYDFKFTNDSSYKKAECDIDCHCKPWNNKI